MVRPEALLEGTFPPTKNSKYSLRLPAKVSRMALT